MSNQPIEEWKDYFISRFIQNLEMIISTKKVEASEASETDYSLNGNPPTLW
jgi:hypothetical protein